MSISLSGLIKDWVDSCPLHSLWEVLGEVMSQLYSGEGCLICDLLKTHIFDIDIDLVSDAVMNIDFDEAAKISHVDISSQKGVQFQIVCCERQV